MRSWICSWLALVVVAFPSSVLASTRLDGELWLGGGLDDGLFRLAMTLPPEAAIRDTYWEVRPRIALTLEPTSAQDLEMRYIGAFRDFTVAANGRAQGHLGELRYRFGLTDGWSLEAMASGALESYSNVSAGYRFGTGSVGALWRPNQELQFGLRAEGQELASSALSGAIYSGVLSAGWSSSALAIGAQVTWSRDQDAWRQYAGQLVASVPVGPLRLVASGLGALVPNGQSLAYSGGVEIRPDDGLGVALRYQGSVEYYKSLTAPLVAHGLSVGVTYRWTEAPANAVDRAPDRRGLDGHGAPGVVTIVVVTPPEVKRVALVGDFNDWNTDGVPLSPVGAGRWQADLDLPAGRYVYQLSIDGALSDAKGASAYVDDGFGGRNAVLVVPGGGRVQQNLVASLGP